MARKTQADDTGTDFDWTAAEPVAATAPPRRSANRNPKQNPWLKWVEQTLTTGEALAQTYPIDKHNDALNLLQHAARVLNCGLKKGFKDNGNGTETVTFLAVAEKKNQHYTAEDVRTWATAQGYRDEHLRPRIHPDIRKAYRQAHGFATAPTDE